MLLKNCTNALLVPLMAVILLVVLSKITQPVVQLPIVVAAWA